MLYTRKGDKGTTKTYGCDQRISKSSAVAEALGSLDEVNSFLGIVKVKAFAANEAAGEKFQINGRSFGDIVHGVQQTLFMVQAEVAGFPMQMTEAKVLEAETLTDAAEKILPPIKTFFISGGTELAASFDVARTLARRAERRVVAVAEGEVGEENASPARRASPVTLAYLNRLSSLLYALARLSNHLSGIKEESPAYK
ncbi:MAG: cob(I)yrinic acid a,c-diamide adenosyltransferase [bacterium]